MKYRVAMYCPDQHVVYDVRVLDRRGVGGGITGRIRLAHALAARGHHVTACVNCPREGVIAGVHYRRFSRVARVETDILIAGSSGGAQDIGPLCALPVEAALRIFMADGVTPPRGIDLRSFDFVSAPSNFVRDLAVERWGWPMEKVFVCHRGVVGGFFKRRWGRVPNRDPYAIVYAAHPSKGLDTALAVSRLLREQDSRFTLYVYGGHRLWGENEQPPAPEPGVIYHGLVGQRRLARELQTCGFSLHLQAREEPFGLAVVESMRAGCIVLASPVGAYPEIISHGRDGFLVPGDHADGETQRRAAHLILGLTQQPDYADYIRRNAMAAPLDWNVVARAWEGHWDWALSRTSDRVENCHTDWEMPDACKQCAGTLLALADGFHCVRCGRYSRVLQMI